MKRIFKRKIYLLLGLTALCSGISGCDDRIDDPVPYSSDAHQLRCIQEQE